MRSARAPGAALEMYLTKRPMRQAPPLSPVMVAVLGLFCEVDPHYRGRFLLVLLVWMDASV